MKKVNQTMLMLMIAMLCLSPGITAKERHLTTAELLAQQQWRLTGTVVDEDGTPLEGVTIAIVGETRSTKTDVNGNFGIEVAVGQVIEFKYLGLGSHRVTITDQRTVRITMAQSVNVLEEVAITALNIAREKRELGYSIGEVKGEELTTARETNVINSLAGRVPGLIINQNAGGPAGSSHVLIRGNTELTGNNQPLYVVDGIPLDNTNYGSAGQWGGFDLGDGISSINPDDIENISVLKGPAASALYGSRASHGVILITTKKARADKRLGIEFNSTTTTETQLTRYDNIQSIYGQGVHGLIYGGDQDRFSSNMSWGPKIDAGLNMVYFDGAVRPYEFIRDNIDGFFRTGLTSTNTVVFNTVRDDTGVRLSYTNLTNRDIVPNSGMNRNTINLRTNTKFAKKLDLDMKVNYVREDVNNRPALSGHRANPGANLVRLATTFDQAWLKDNYVTAEGEYADWNARNAYNLNPYWIINEMSNVSDKNQVMASALLRYQITPKLQAQLTGGGEINMFGFQEFAPPTTPGFEPGFLQNSSFSNFLYNTELLLIFRDKKGKFDYGFNAGGNVFYVNNMTDIVTARNMQMRETVALQSFLEKEIVEDSYRKQINSLFAMGNVGFDNLLFLDATIRMDQSSTLPSNNNTYVYPSISGSFMFSELLNMKSILPYGKLRASFAQVGSDTDPYQLSLMYGLTDKTYDGYSLANVFNLTIPNTQLRPTRTNSAEYGLELKFLQNRIGFDFTYYTQSSKDQIMSLNTSITSGYRAQLINAGEISNRGIEMVLNTRPIQKEDFSWDLNFNVARHRNEVTALADGITNFELESAAWMGVLVSAVVGENYGSIMGRDYQRSPSGDILINPSTGYPMVSTNLQVLGNAMWDWTGGMLTAVNYKDFSLSGIFDIKLGSDLFSMTQAAMYQGGKALETLEGRDAWYRSEEQRLAAGVMPANWTPTGGYLASGVIATTNAEGVTTYRPNDILVNPQEYWTFMTNNIATPFIYDNSYLKMREISLSYRFPNRLVNKFAEAMSISVVARNPFILYRNVENIDPDSNYNNGRGMGLEFGSLPSRRSFGFNLNVRF